MKPRLLYQAETIKEAHEMLARLMQFIRKDEEEINLLKKHSHTDVKPIKVEIKNNTEIWRIG